MKILRITALILLFIFLGTLLVHSLNSINQDIGRHIKSGEIIWQEKEVYKDNHFSFTEPGQPFINHHWLSEVVFFGLNNVIGLKGLIIFKALIILLAFFILFQSVKKNTGIWPFLVAGLIGIIIFSTRTDVRPEMFSYLFFSIFLFAILRAKYAGEYKWLYALPLIQLFWSNMHIYFALGPGILFLFLIDRWVHEKDKKLVKKVGLIFIATSLVTLINPNFMKGALTPFTILSNYGYSIVENQNIFFLKELGILTRAINVFEISILALIVSFIIAFKYGKRKLTFEILASLAFVIFAGKMIRNFGPYALVFVPIVALNLSAYGPKSLKKALRAAIYVLAILGLVFLIKSSVNNDFYRWEGSSNSFGFEVPAGAENGLKFVKENNIQGPVFNNFDVGSFLIWRLYPEQRVFVDGRPEAYSVEFLEKYKAMQEDPILWQKYSEEYGINYIFFDHHDITPWARSFLAHISQNPEWPMVYQDNSVVIFLRQTPANAGVIDK